MKRTLIAYWTEYSCRQGAGCFFEPECEHKVLGEDVTGMGPFERILVTATPAGYSDQPGVNLKSYEAAVFQARNVLPTLLQEGGKIYFL